LFDRLSVEQHLIFYSMVKGIKIELIKKIVDQTIKKLDLVDHKHKTADSLSGGNKRKLQVAIAIIGNP
jgi:ABC-type multidrug transport system ATPase subunit